MTYALTAFLLLLILAMPAGWVAAAFGIAVVVRIAVWLGSGRII